MKTTFLNLDGNERPDEFAEYLDQPVYRAYVVEKRLLIILESKRCLMFEAMPLIIGTDKAISVQIGTLKPGGGLVQDLDRTHASLHSVALRGRKFTGLDCDVVMFDDLYGAKITPEGVIWTRVAGLADETR